MEADELMDDDLFADLFVTPLLVWLSRVVVVWGGQIEARRLIAMIMTVMVTMNPLSLHKQIKQN